MLKRKLLMLNSQDWTRWNDVLFKFKKPLHPRDILKFFVRKKVKEENEDNMKWLITSKPYSLKNVNVCPKLRKKKVMKIFH